MRHSKVVAVVFSLVLFSTTASAASLYVSLSGNDASSGTQAAPFRTINKASAMAKPGDVVNVRGGVYNERVTIAAKGTAAARILFRSNPGETAVIDGTGTDASKVLFSLSGTQYVDVSGFEVRNAPFIAISGWGTQNTRVLSNVVHHSVRNGIYFGYDTAGVSTDVTIEGNTVYNCVLENTAHAMQGGWASTVSLDLTERATVANNKIYNNDGEAIAVILSNHAVITGNENFDNYSQGVYLDNARYNTVDGNLIYSTGNTRYFRDGYPGMGIAIASEFYDTANPSSDNTIINNIVVNTRWAFLYGNFELGGGLKNTVIAHNTFYKSSGALIEIWQDAHSNSVVENNIFYQVGGTAVATLQGTGVTFRNNHWYGGTPTGATAGIGDVYGNPAFANAGGVKAADYKLTAGSMAIAKALDVTSLVKSDYFGTARALPLDMGAHQLSGAASTTDTQAPTAPSNLHAVSGDTVRVDIAWNAATDNVGVTGYTVLRNNVTVATTTATTWSDLAVVAGIKYNYQVVARDATGNQSSASNLLELAWDASLGNAKDTAAPSTPSALRAGAVTTTTVQLTWNPSTDNVSVTRYKLYRDGAMVRIITNGTSVTDNSLTPGQTYSYKVVALDAAGNTSEQSNVIAVKTTAAGRTRSAGR